MFQKVIYIAMDSMMGLSDNLDQAVLKNHHLKRGKNLKLFDKIRIMAILSGVILLLERVAYLDNRTKWIEILALPDSFFMEYI